MMCEGWLVIYTIAIVLTVRVARESKSLVELLGKFRGEESGRMSQHYYIVLRLHPFELIVFLDHEL
jgi:hypothetical protein